MEIPDRVEELLHLFFIVFPFLSFSLGGSPLFEVLDWMFEVGKTISISFFHISETLVALDAANNGAQIAHKRGAKG